MFKQLQLSLLFLVFGGCLIAQNQSPKNFVVGEDVLGTRVFIENKGQFNNPLNKDEKVLFVYDHFNEKIFFTENGLIYEMMDKNTLTEEEMEAIEHGQPNPNAKMPEVHHIKMAWLNANQNKTIAPSDKQNHYFTYGGPEYNSSTFKTITYQNVYPNIDVEYFIPKDKKVGVKYNVIVHAGADYKNFKIAYSGDVKKIKLLKTGDVEVKTSVESIIEHAPLSFDTQKNIIQSEFVIDNNTIGFKLPDNFEKEKDFVIDPWVSAITTLTTNNYAYDVDYDFSGNVFIYGGNGSGSGNGKYKVAKYSNVGALIWTFSGIVTSTGWHTGNSWSGNFKVNRGTSKTYVARNNSTPYVIRLDANGNYDNFASNTSTFTPILQEVWNMEFNCGGDIQLFGGWNYSGAIINATTGIQSSASTFSPNITNCCQDVVSVAVDPVGNTFVTYLGHTQLSNRIALVAPSYTNSLWLAPTGFGSLNYLQSKNGYVGANTGAAVAFNALAVNMNYVFYYDGRNIGVYSKTTGSTVATTSNSLTAGQQGGIAVDDCNNIYLGGNGFVMCYNFNGTSFSTLTPIALNSPTNNAYAYVYDIQFNKLNNQLYVCGSGFVSNYNAVHSTTCQPAQVQNPCGFGQFVLVATSNSINCANLQGSATVTPVGGIGPFTYTWLPGGQTGSVASGLGPGTYTVISNDIGSNFNFTSFIAFTPSVPLTGNVLSTPILNCFGLTNGTASIANISGGSGNQNYIWKIGNTTLTTPTVGGLGAGVYTVTVNDALTSCSFSHTFTVLQPQQLGVMIFANNPTVCAGGSSTLTAIGSGGSPGYTFTWTNGPSTDTFVVTQNTAGVSNYSISIQDNNGCPFTGVTTVTFVANPTLSVANVFICPLQTGTLSASGASTYTWNNAFVSNTFTNNPTANQEYTVLGSALSCTSLATASIIIKPIPVATLTSNSPVCNGQNLVFNAMGGASFVWSGPQSYSSLLQTNTIVAASPVHSGVYTTTVTGANACTATALINLTVHPTPTLSAVGANICNTQTLNLISNSVPGANYFWNGPNAYNSNLQNPVIANPPAGASGNYTVRATSAQGCTNSAIAIVTITTMPSTFPSNNSPICFGRNLNLNGNNTNGALNYSWAGPNGFNSLLQSLTLNNVGLNSTGVYTLTVYAGPCVNSNTTAVVVNALPSATAISNEPVCENTTLRLNVSVPSNNIIHSYVWQGPGSFVAYVPAAQINSSQLMHSGVYTILVTDNNGCQNSSTTTVTILNNPTVSAVGDTVCLNDPALLKGFGALTFEWFSNTANFSSQQNAIITKALNLSPTVYTVVGAAANTCTASATATLFTWALPQPSLTVEPKNSACMFSTFNLNADGASYYYWKGPGDKLFNGKKIQIFADNISYGGTYTLTGVDTNNCKTDITTEITIFNLPQGLLSKGLKEACIPFTSEFVFTPSFDTYSITAFTWNLDGRTYTTTSFIKTFNKPGSYPLKAKMTDINGCSNTMSVLINAWPQPIADFTYSPVRPIENLEEVEFKSTSPSINLKKWNWFFAPEVNQKTGFTSDKEITYYSFKEAGNYPVALVIMNNHGCLDSIVKVINVQEDFNVFIPTGFTPNADNKNDIFIPVTRGVKDYHFYVFDRWNELMFETVDPNVGWNGTHKGIECKQDVYVWKLIVTSKNNEQRVYTGEVSLIK